MTRSRFLPLLVVAIAAGLLAPAPAAAETGPMCAGRRATIVGTGGPDRLVGTDGSDVIVGFGGADVIYGRGGDDYICANQGHDQVYGEDGDDHIYGGPGKGYLYGGDGNDRLVGGDQIDRLRGDAGADVLLGGLGNDTLKGGLGPDRLYGGGGADGLDGERGRDSINGGPGVDRLRFLVHRGVEVNLTRGTVLTSDGAGSVTAVEDVWGTPGDDVLIGDDRANELVSGGGRDRLEGRGGNDYLMGGAELLGGAGNDVLRDFYAGAPETMWGHSGNDRFITRWNGQTTAVGGPGGDRFEVLDYCVYGRTDCGRDNTMRFYAGDGTDRFLVDAHDGHRIDLRAGTSTSSTTGLTVLIRNFEEVVGTRGDDTIIGSDRPEYLMGSSGEDTIQGGGGNDILAGGSRAFDTCSDTIQGEGGDDVCYTSSPPHGDGPQDTIETCEDIRAASR